MSPTLLRASAWASVLTGDASLQSTLIIGLLAVIVVWLVVDRYGQ